MKARQYLDLDLVLEADGTGYVARIVDSPSGEASHRFRLPFNEVGLENFILKLGHNRGTTRRARSSRLDTARSFGAELYRAVFDGEVEVTFRRSLDEARRADKGLRLRLRMDAAPALAEIPWEYLYAEGLGRFVVMSSDTPLIRYLDLPSSGERLTVAPPLRVLVVVASPSDLDPLDVDAEVRLLRQATADLSSSGLIELDVLSDATLSTLMRRLRTNEYHVFHFVGHGVFEAKDGDGVLMLEDETGHSRPVSGLDLGVLLHDHHSLRLAMLNACEGARGSVENPLGGVAQSLIRQGLPAAIAMQFEISDEAALIFAHEFYMAVADGFPIEAATEEARKAIFASGNDVEWGTPVVHLRAKDGRIFDLQKPAEANPDRPEREAATALMAEQNFPEAATAWENILAKAPNDEAAALMLARARAAAGESPTEALAPDLATMAAPEPEPTPAPVPEVVATAFEPAPTPTPTPVPEPTPRPTPIAPAPRRRSKALWWVLGLGGLGLVGLMAVVILLEALSQTSTTTTFFPPATTGTSLVELPPDTVAVAPVFGIVVDGDPSEWNVPTAAVSEHVVASGGAEFSVVGQWGLGWDETFLYVVAGVEDPVFHPGDFADPSQLWKGDSVNFEFGPDPSGAAGLRNGDMHVLFGPVDQSSIEVVTAINPAIDGQFQIGPDNSLRTDIVAAVGWFDGGYVVEAAIPWTVLGVTPQPGEVFGLNLNVSDRRGDGELAQMVSSNPDRTANNQARPETWHKAVVLSG